MYTLRNLPDDRCPPSMSLTFPTSTSTGNRCTRCSNLHGMPPHGPIRRRSSSPHANGPHTPTSRAPRAVIACQRCRDKKLKCIGGRPCRSCSRAKMDCTFGGHEDDTAARLARAEAVIASLVSDVAELKETWKGGLGRRPHVSSSSGVSHIELHHSHTIITFSTNDSRWCGRQMGDHDL